jgi:site-specific recombinase XerD
MPKYRSPFLTYIYEQMLARHYAKRTIETYIYWIWRYIAFHNKQHPKVLSANDVESFLSHLANQRDNAPATQEIALNALVIFIKKWVTPDRKITIAGT